MHGQWLGIFSAQDSPNKFGAMLNVDKDYASFARLALYDLSAPFNKNWVDVHFSKGAGGLRAILVFPSRETGAPTKGEIQVDQNSETAMSGSWQTDLNKGRFELSRFGDKQPTEADEVVNNWDEFKEWISRNDPQNFIYRGQEQNSWRLGTSFHRTGKYDLVRYGGEVVRQLNHYLTGILGRSFNLNDSAEHGALLNLAQHHGFPTPLLDWTESPYIAAFFAYSALMKNIQDAELGAKVRIFAFDRVAWLTDHQSVTEMTLAAPYFSVHQLLPLFNTRAVPQQSVVTSTNVGDIEAWIKTQEPPHRKYLIKLDLPASERDVVMKELNLMGITAASLFPGVEGTCAALKEKYF